MSIYTEFCPFLYEGRLCSNIPHHLWLFVMNRTEFPWWYILDIYRTHSGRDEFLGRGRTDSWGRKREELSLHSDGHFLTQDFQIILSSSSLLAHYHCAQFKRGPKIFREGTKRGPDFEPKGDLKGTKKGPKRGPKLGLFKKSKRDYILKF